MRLQDLDEKLRAVCPILGVNSDRMISFADEATDSQRAAAQAIADAAVIDGIPTFSLKAALLRIRDARKPVLDALTGIAGRAQRAGNTALAAEADALSQSLLDVTKAPIVLAAIAVQDDEAVDHAVLAYYRTQAATASAPVQAAFNEIAT